MKLEIKTNMKRVRHTDKYGMVGERLQPVVEVWIDGICCTHDCNTSEQARALAIRLSYALGIE